MPVIIVGNEKNFTGLRSRIFSGRVPTAAAKEVSDAIAAANPHVNLDKLEPGTVLTVPDLPHVKVAGDLSLDETTKEVLAGIAQSGADALDDLLAAARSAERDAAAERKQLTATLSSKDVSDAGGRNKDLGDDVKAVQKAVADEEKAAKDRATALQDASTSWSAELKTLQGLLS
jgi:hypothetical protein